MTAVAVVPDRIVISGGLVFDGAGAPAREADVLIEGAHVVVIDPARLDARLDQLRSRARPLSHLGQPRTGRFLEGARR